MQATAIRSFAAMGRNRPTGNPLLHYVMSPYGVAYFQQVALLTSGDHVARLLERILEDALCEPEAVDNQGSPHHTPRDTDIASWHGPCHQLHWAAAPPEAPPEAGSGGAALDRERGGAGGLGLGLMPRTLRSPCPPPQQGDGGKAFLSAVFVREAADKNRCLLVRPTMAQPPK